MSACCTAREVKTCQKWTGIVISVILLLSTITAIVYSAWIIGVDHQRYGDGDNCRFLGFTNLFPPPTPVNITTTTSVTTTVIAFNATDCASAVAHWDCQHDGNISYPLHSATVAPPSPTMDSGNSSNRGNDTVTSEMLGECGLPYVSGKIYVCPLIILHSGPNQTTPPSMQCLGPSHEYWVDALFWVAIGLLSLLIVIWSIIGTLRLVHYCSERRLTYNQL